MTIKGKKRTYASCRNPRHTAISLPEAATGVRLYLPRTEEGAGCWYHFSFLTLKRAPPGDFRAGSFDTKRNGRNGDKTAGN